MVGQPAKEVFTLGENPPPASSHTPSPSPLHQPAGSLMDMFGQIGQAHHVLNHFSNLLVSSCIPQGAEVAKEDGGVPSWALISGLLDVL
jgi:hypothetical protein